jgi:hypothetical protein
MFDGRCCDTKFASKSCSLFIEVTYYTLPLPGLLARILRQLLESERVGGAEQRFASDMDGQEDTDTTEICRAGARRSSDNGKFKEDLASPWTEQGASESDSFPQ